MTTNTDMYRSYTESAGKLSRQLALIGGGLIWLFHGQVAGTTGELAVALDYWLARALSLICASILIDVLQESIGSFLWYKEFKKCADGQAENARRPICFANVCIFLKLFFMSLAYVFLIIFLIRTQILVLTT